MQSCNHSLSKHFTVFAKNMFLFSSLRCTIVDLTIVMLPIAVLFLPAVYISDNLLYIVSFCFFFLIFTFTIDTEFTKNKPLRLL